MHILRKRPCPVWMDRPESAHPYRNVLAAVDSMDPVSADLIVMGTVGRTGIAGLIIGNTAENVLQRTRASVLAVKPDGFVSPVTLP